MMSAVVALAAESGAQTSPWLAPIIGVIIAVLGGGGLAALLKVRHDKRVGIAQEERAEDDSLATRWESLIQAQTKTLLEPMIQRIGVLEGKVLTLETDLATSRRKYWALVSYVRTLLTWIARNMPEDLEATAVPEPPTTLAEDI